MEPEKVGSRKGLSADSSYCCAACHGDEDTVLGRPIRGRAKSRSLSAAPALASTKEFRRTRSLHGPCPVTTFGPKACVLQNPQTIMHIQDPASQRLTWSKSPKSVLVIRKIRDASLLQPFKELCAYLMEEKNMIVYVEKKVLEDPAIMGDDSFGPVKRKFCTFREDYDDISNQIDFIICLGGDGTLLHASSLFQGSVPPVMAFHLGSLGFLTPFNFENFQTQVTQVIQGNAAVVLRSRLKVKVVKELRGKKTATPNGLSENGVLASDRDTEAGKQVMQYQVLNEVVIDRGPSSYLSNVDVYLDGHLITTVQGDDHAVTGSQEYRLGVPGWTEEAGDPPWRQHQHHYLVLPAPFHLRPRPCERLVREPGPVSALERPQAAGALHGRGGRGGGGLAGACCTLVVPSHIPTWASAVTSLMSVVREGAQNLPFVDQISCF
ncbi:NAD kinase isoform X3 [Sturnira hondurensis]|uniref:NAD kinase isoform X3 n=1 Tax=Sturnira hondurensis TaxID=192404 RepID=UPI001879A1CE|nr:NAD kinase isoform X3 [Sturnira hondurensis]